MANIGIAGANLGTSLQRLLMCDEIVPGAMASYQVCKEIRLWHPLGEKIVAFPIKKAMSQKRKISIPGSPEELVKKAFEKQWKVDKADRNIRNLMCLARTYGLSSIAIVADGENTATPINYAKIAKMNIGFNCFDPLNTAGSLVLNQDPNATDFLKPTAISVNGQVYHPSRTCVMMNEEPIYISYTSSAYGFVGRSVYQRALFPLKSFINTMIADDMVARKSGVLIAKIKQPGSIIDNVMRQIGGLKRAILKEAENNNVISVDVTEDIESLNLTNVNMALALSRKDILENIATATPMPAQMLNNETFAEGFGEGVEDSKNVAQYIDGLREDMEHPYDFMDNIVQRRAWSPEFYETIQAQFPESYANKSYEQTFYEWKNAFTAEWPSLLIEPESEQAKAEDVRLKAIIALTEILMPALDPVNKATVIEWASENFNSMKLLFSTPLTLEFDDLEQWAVEEAERAKALPEDGPKEPAEPKPFSAADAEASINRPGLRRYNDAMAAFITDKALGSKTRGRVRPHLIAAE
jgi:hypothetical protein